VSNQAFRPLGQIGDGNSIIAAPPGEPLDGPRLVMCYDCGTLTKIAPAPDTPEDIEAFRVVRDHQHMERGPHDVHMQLFPTSQATWDRLDVTTEFRKELMANQVYVAAYRDQVGEDAVKCHQQHGQPAWPGSPCIDYKSDAKKLGGGLGRRKSIALLRDPQRLQYLCTYCPYESTVTTQKRWDRGDYKQ
jgi:hypothetical protein